jgi:hypothetical protein
MGRPAKRLRLVASRATADVAGFHVCRGGFGRSRRDRGLHQRRPDPEIRPGGRWTIRKARYRLMMRSF